MPFAVGDRVRVVSDSVIPENVGHVGTVTDVDPNTALLYPYIVSFDVPVREHRFNSFKDDELELATSAPAEPMITREQIYQVAQDAARYPLTWRERHILDAVVALIENGTKN